MFYFDEEEEGDEEWGITKPAPSPTSKQANQNPKLSILQDILKRITHSETVILERVFLYLNTMEVKTGEQQMKKLNQWIVQRLMKDGFEASLYKSSWAASTFSRPSGFEITVNYEYIDVIMRENNSNGGVGSTVRLIVDMDFKSQFELARPTKTYSEFSDSLPCIFVGTEEKLIKIITLLCSAAKRSLKNRGLHIPPWRKASYMQSKWLSEDRKKVSFSSIGS